MPRQATGAPRWNATKKVWEARLSGVPGHDRVPVAMPGIGPCSKTPRCSLKGGVLRCESCTAAIAMALVVVKRAKQIGAVPLESGKVVREWSDEWIEDRVRRGLVSDLVGGVAGAVGLLASIPQAATKIVRAA